MSFLATKYGVFAFLLIRLNSSSNIFVWSSFWPTSAVIFKTDAVNEQKAFIRGLILQWPLTEANLPPNLGPRFSSIHRTHTIYFTFDLMHGLYLKLKMFNSSSFPFSNHSEIFWPGFSRVHISVKCWDISCDRAIMVNTKILIWKQQRQYFPLQLCKWKKYFFDSLISTKHKSP